MPVLLNANSEKEWLRSLAFPEMNQRKADIEGEAGCHDRLTDAVSIRYYSALAYPCLHLPGIKEACQPLFSFPSLRIILNIICYYIHGFTSP